MLNFRQKCITYFNDFEKKASLYAANNKNICWIVGFTIVLISLCIRSTMYIGTDPSFYYITAARILRGERYYYDFFETNFPINFYIFTIPVIFHKITGIGQIPSFVGFITIVALGGIYFSNLILKKTSVYKDGIFYNLLIIGLFLGYFFPIGTFPLNEIGTKTVLFISFILPYFCSFFLEADNKKLPLTASIIIGVFAGLAVCLKPHYAVFPIVMETYLLIKTRNFQYIFRPMNYTIVLVNILHITWLVIFLPEYIFKIIPMVSVAYHGLNNNFFKKFCEIVFETQGFLIFIILVTYNKIPKSEYNKILYYSVAATSIIAGSESLGSFDQISLLYFFDGLLLIKILLDIFRYKPTFKYYQTSLLYMSFIWLINICTLNLYPSNFVKDNFDQVRAIIKKESNGEQILMLTRLIYTPLFLDNDKLHYNKIATLAFLRGAENTKIRHLDNPDSYLYKMADETEKYIVNSEIEQIIHYNPKLIFIENLSVSLQDNTCTIPYIEYFMQYDAFRKAFSNYEFYDRIITMDPQVMRKYRNNIFNNISVYIRKEPGKPEKLPLKFQGIFF